MKAASAIQAAIDFIEANLKEPISIGDIANHAGLSFWHFQRAFALVAKESVGSYLRKRRIQESMKELLLGKLRIIDVAFEYQFESHEVYTRAFRSLFGLPPSRYRELGNRLKYPKLLLSDSISNFKNGGRIMMIPNIMKLGPIKLVGMEIGPNELLNEELPIANLWKRFFQVSGQIENVVKGKAWGLYAPTLEAQGITEARYVAALEVESFASMPDATNSYEIEASDYAVFEHTGSTEKLTESQAYIYEKWLPESSYRIKEGFDIEIYGNSYDSEGIIELAVPVEARR